MDTEKAGGNPTEASHDMTLDELAQLEAKGQNPNAGFEVAPTQEPKATVSEKPVVKPTEAKETDWKREKELAQTEIGRLNKLKGDLEKLQRDATLQQEMVKRLERQERMLNALGEIMSSQTAEQPFPQEPPQESKSNKVKELWDKLQEESAAEQLSSMLSVSGLDINDARLSYVRKASSKQDQVDRLQALLPILERKQEEPHPVKESVEDIEARVRRQVLSELGRVDVGATGNPGRSSFADYARDFASGKISREEYRDAKKKYGVE